MVRAESGCLLRGWQEDVGEERGRETPLHRIPLSSPALSLKVVWEGEEVELTSSASEVCECV